MDTHVVNTARSDFQGLPSNFISKADVGVRAVLRVQRALVWHAVACHEQCVDETMTASSGCLLSLLACIFEGERF